MGHLEGRRIRGAPEKERVEELFITSSRPGSIKVKTNSEESETKPDLYVKLERQCLSGEHQGTPPIGVRDRIGETRTPTEQTDIGDIVNLRNTLGIYSVATVGDWAGREGGRTSDIEACMWERLLVSFHRIKSRETGRILSHYLSSASKQCQESSGPQMLIDIVGNRVAVIANRPRLCSRFKLHSPGQFDPNFVQKNNPRINPPLIFRDLRPRPIINPNYIIRLFSVRTTPRTHLSNVPILLPSPRPRPLP